MTFLNKDVAWAVYDSCPARGHREPGCHYLLGRTVDGGRTWSPVTLPQIPAEAFLSLHPFDANTLTIQLWGDTQPGLLHTTDAGATFTRVPFDRPPAEAQWVRGGRFQMLCPGATGLELVGPKMNCSRRQLVRVGSARPPAPPLTGPLAKTVNGGDGRVWLVEDGEMRVSSDAGVTWSPVPQAPGDAWEQRPRISPDGRDVWLEGNGKLLRLNDSGWQEVPGYPAEFRGSGFWRQLEGWAPLGDGLLLISYDGKLAYLDNGELTVVPAVLGGEIDVLADGTVVVLTRDGREVIGVGQGTRREWIKFS